MLSVLGAESSHSEAVGIAELAQVEIELVEQSQVAGPSAVVAVAAADGKNTLLIQLNGGCFAVTVALMRPLLPDHEVVAHYLSVNADSQFIWWSNGERVADFELFGLGPVIVDERVVDLISEVGRIGIGDDGQNQPGKHAVEGAFALAERITGASVPAALFEAGRFTVGAQVPPAYRLPSPSRQRLPSLWSEVARCNEGAERIPRQGSCPTRGLGGLASTRLEF